MKTITVQTSEKKEVVDITDKINAALMQFEKHEGVCHIFVTHTTAALSTADLDPGTDQDMLDAYYGMLPHLDYRHPHDPEHAPDHIIATLIGPSVTVPVEDGELVLGTWQCVVLFELDGPRERTVVVDFLPTD